MNSVMQSCQLQQQSSLHRPVQAVPAIGMMQQLGPTPHRLPLSLSSQQAVTGSRSSQLHPCLLQRSMRSWAQRATSQNGSSPALGSSQVQLHQQWQHRKRSPALERTKTCTTWLASIPQGQRSSSLTHRRATCSAQYAHPCAFMGSRPCTRWEQWRDWPGHTRGTARRELPSAGQQPAARLGACVCAGQPHEPGAQEAAAAGGQRGGVCARQAPPGWLGDAPQQLAAQAGAARSFHQVLRPSWPRSLPIAPLLQCCSQPGGPLPCMLGCTPRLQQCSPGAEC